MAQEISGLLVRIEATTALLRAEMRRAKAEVDNTAAGFEVGARRAEAAVDRMQTAAASKARLTTNQLNTLKFTVSDIVASLGSGISPMQILLQQGPQVAQAFSFSLGPVALAVGAVGAAVLTTYAAYESYRSSIGQITQAHRTMGGYLGVTTQQLNKMAEAAAETGNISISAARDQVAAYTRTGTIGVQTMQGLIELSRDYAAATGRDMAEATRHLAKIFTDPQTAMQALQEELRLLSDREQEYVKSLIAANEAQKATDYLMDKTAQRTAKAAENVGILGRAWRGFADDIKDLWNGLGEWADKNIVVKPPDPYDETAREKQLEDRIKRHNEVDMSGATPEMKAYRNERLRLMQEELDLLRQQRQAQVTLLEQEAVRVALAAKLREESNKVAELVRESGGGAQALEIEQLEMSLALLERNRDNPEIGDRTRAAEKVVEEQMRNRLSGLQLAESEGMDLDSYKKMLSLRAQEKAILMKDGEAQLFLAEREAEIDLIGSSTTALQRNLTVRQAMAGVKVAQARAEFDVLQGISLQVDAQNRLTAAAGLGEAAIRRANAESEIAAAYARSDAEGRVKEQTALGVETAISTAIMREHGAELVRTGSAQADLNKAMERGPEYVQEMTDVLEANDHALRVGTLGSERYKTALESYYNSMKAITSLRTTGALQGLVREGAREGADASLRLSMVGKTQAEQARILAHQRATEALRQAGITNLVRLNEEQQKLVDKTFQQAESQVEVEIAIERTQGIYDEFANVIDQSFERIGGAITDAFAKGEISAIKFGDVGRAVVAELVQEMVKLSLLNPIKNSLFGTALPIISGVVGAGLSGLQSSWTHGFSNVGGAGGTYGGVENGPQHRASGGPVIAGQPYIVGEQRAELFVPNVSGMIRPSVPGVSAANQNGGGDNIHIALNISTGVAATVKAEINGMMPAITQSVKGAVVDARQRGGAYSRSMGS